jgi:hypothetical protein
LEDWLELMDKHEIYKHYDLYSLGGLVGLKKETNVHFNHFVPMTIWLLGYIYNRRKMETPFPAKIKQVHMLGQSSRVAIITGSIVEKLFGVKITMDSSEIIRFRPIQSKTPLIHGHTDGFDVINNLEDMTTMLDAHSDPEAAAEIESMKKDLLEGKVSNQTFIELICQNLDNTIKFADHLIEENDINDIISWEEDDFKKFHDVFKIGRLAKELANNMRLIRTLKPYLDDNNFIGLHEYVMKIISNYYSGNSTKTGEI